jgi:hypothetical protein
MVDRRRRLIKDEHLPHTTKAPTFDAKGTKQTQGGGRYLRLAKQRSRQAQQLSLTHRQGLPLLVHDAIEAPRQRPHVLIEADRAQ